MTSPLQTQITDLPTAGSVTDDDYTIVRQGLADYKAKLGLIREIDFSLYPVSPTPIPSDLMLINRGGATYSIRFERVGFEVGTTMWFYQVAPPSGWETTGATGDRLLAVKGGSNQYQTFGEQGTWQQSGHALTIQQIPPHQHRILKTKEKTGSSNSLGPVRGKEAGGGEYATQSTGGQGSTTSGGNGAPALAHNHGNIWRPPAAVGILARKLT